LEFEVCSLQFAVCSLQFAVCSLLVCSLQFLQFLISREISQAGKRAFWWFGGV
jgi:hypothetical protein